MLTLGIIAIVVISALAFVFMPRKSRNVYHSETGHNARLAATINGLDTAKHAKRLNNWVK